MPDESIERRHFEEWVKSVYENLDLIRQDTGYSIPGLYIDSFVRSMWEAWFERARHGYIGLRNPGSEK